MDQVLFCSPLLAFPRMPAGGEVGRDRRPGFSQAKQLGPKTTPTPGYGGSFHYPCQFSFPATVPLTVVTGNVVESMVSQEREVESERHRDKETQRRARRAMQGKKERGGKRHGVQWKAGRTGRSARAGASQPIKSLEWKEGARETLASAQAQSWLSAE